ncbi:MAG: hypothetical protein R2733_09465 [Acidimicrobiales bacterium]
MEYGAQLDTMTSDFVSMPSVRGQLVQALATLADPLWQRQTWVGHQPPWDAVSDFDTDVGELYDGVSVLPDPRQMLGRVLLNEHEVEAIARLGRAIDAIHNKYGKDTTGRDAEIIEDPLWPEVLDSARAALAMLLNPRIFQVRWFQDNHHTPYEDDPHPLDEK